MALLEFHNLEKRYGRKEVLRGISFSINKGDIFGLVGRSGCGKTTLLKILMGLVSLDKGDITFEDLKFRKKLNYLRKNTGYASQEDTLFEELTIKENAYYFGKLYGLNKKQIKLNLDDLLVLLGLDGFENFEVRSLSGGMNKRTNLLVSIIHGPRLLILDEPTVGLDSLLRHSIWNYIKKINKNGTTILVTSHLLDELEENCNKIAVMKKGKIAESRTLEEYSKKYGEKPFARIFEEIIK